MIRALEGQYRFLSNFYSCYVLYDDIEYPSVENAYQAAKCLWESDRPYFETCKASEAKRQGRVVEMRPDWEEVKIEIMLDLVRQKFQQPMLRRKLLETIPHEIQEGNWWGDTFWGTVNGKGQNHLGKILLKVRDELENR